MPDKVNLPGSLLTLVVVLLVATWGCGGGSIPAPVKSAEERALAPDFTLEKIGGGSLNLASTNGQVRIVDFWATWCAPCIEEIPMYKEIHGEWADKGVQIIAISSDDGVDIVKSFVEKNGIPYTNLMADDEVGDAFGVAGLPATFVIDKQGRIVKSFVGVKPKKVLVSLIRDLLEEPGA